MEPATKHYADRDARALDKAGGYYTRHVCAMTAEQLHAKSDIAAELGWRDMQIESLRAQLDGVTENYNNLLAMVYADSPQFVEAAPSQQAPTQDCEWTNCPRRVGDVCCNEQQAPVAQGGPVAEYRGMAEDGHYVIKAMAPLSRGMLFYTHPQQASEPMTRSGTYVQHLPSDDTEGGAT
jgi:hypothetical protein